ncbi:FG-GAP repeat domain-containing protein [Saltatorellus ferox]
MLLTFAASGPVSGTPASAGPQSGGAVIRLSETTPDLRDPRLDGWKTEAFAEDAGAVLKAWKHEFADGPAESSRRRAAEGLIHVPVPEGLQRVRDTGSFTATRWTRALVGAEVGNRDDAEREDAERRDTERQDLGDLVALMRGPFQGHAHVLIKVTGVTPSEVPGAPWRTALLLEVGGHSAERGWHSTATGTADWQIAEGERGAPRLLDLTLDSFESTELRIPGGQLFEDVTATVLEGEPAWTEQLLVGQDRWARTIEERLGMGLYKHSGIAVGDANGDGLEDLYVAQPAGLPNLLLLKDARGGLHDVAAAAGVDWLDHTSSALLLDLDGDGDQDLAATVGGVLVVHENLGFQDGSEGGAPRFRARPPLTSQDTDLYGLSAADVDLDGDLDLYVTADFANKRRDESTTERARFDYVDANDGGRNVLWRNVGGLRFEDATAELGLDVNNQRHSLAATWRDLDRDGDIDLYVANDYGHNCLYRNRSELGERRVGPLFEECAESCGVEDRGSGMSIDVGDPNRDGELDLLVANMWSSAGRRVVPQKGFGAADSAAERDQFSRFAKGNTLFLASSGDSERYAEASRGANIERGRWAWGTPFIDLDGDGWEDMLVGNGYVTSHDTGDL